MIVDKRGLQENQIEEAREAVKNGADSEQEAWKLARIDIDAREKKSVEEKKRQITRNVLNGGHVDGRDHKTAKR